MMMYPRNLFFPLLAFLLAFCLINPLGLVVCESSRLYAQEDSDFDDFGSDDSDSDSDSDSLELEDGFEDDYQDDAFSQQSTSTNRQETTEFSGGVRKLPPSVVPNNPVELSAEESLALLDKLEKDFYDNPENITPKETIRAVYLFSKYGSEQKSLPFMKSLLIRFEKAELSERELFDIADQLGRSTLTQILAQRSLAPENERVVERILNGYQSHIEKRGSFESFLMKDFLNSLDPSASNQLTDPEEIMFAANEISKGDRIEVAGALLKRFLEMKTTPEQLHRLNKELGSADIIRIMTLPELQPTGELVAKRIVEGADAYRKAQSGESTPESEKETPEQIAHPTPVRGPLAFWKGTETSLEDLIEILCDSQDEKEIEQLETTLKSFGWNALSAAVVVLESGNDQRVARCAHFLSSRLDSEFAYLLFPAMFDARLQPQTRNLVGQYVEQLTVSRPDEFDAATDLYKVATQYGDKELPLPINASGQAVLWLLNKTAEKEGLPQCVLFPAVDAYRFQTARYAEHAYKIFPQQQEIKTLYQASVLDRLINENGLDQQRSEKMQQETENWTLFDLEAILVEAIQRNLTGAGVAAAELLGTRGTAAELLLPNSDVQRPQVAARNVFVRPRALVRATQCSDRRIRFAATKAVMNLKPSQSYPGSSFVSDSLMWFANADGQKVAIVACPKIADAMRISGLLVDQGYKTKIVTNWRDIILEAEKTPDVELVFVDQRCMEPTRVDTRKMKPAFIDKRPIDPREVDSIFSNERYTNPPTLTFARYMYKNPKTREIPIAILSLDEKLLQKSIDFFGEKPLPLMSELEKSYGDTALAETLAMVFPHPQDDEAAKFILQRLKKMTGANPVPDQQRLAHAKESLGWLGEIAKNHSQLYRIENLELLAQRAAYSPQLSTEGIELLAQIRSNVMQNMLANIAMLKNIPDDVREQAADAFEQSVKNYGILIRGHQVKTLLDVLAEPQEEEQDPIYDRLEKTIETAASRLGRTVK